MDNAFEEAVGGGFGAWRLRTELEDEYAEDEEEEDYQRIRFEPIFDADSTVFFDLNAKRQDKSDAMLAFVLTAMTPEAYKAEWNDDPASWPKSVYMTQFDWSTQDAVYVAEYYVVEKRKERIFVYADVLGNEEEYTRDDMEDEDEEPLPLAPPMCEGKDEKECLICKLPFEVSLHCPHSLAAVVSLDAHIGAGALRTEGCPHRLEGSHLPYLGSSR